MGGNLPVNLFESIAHEDGTLFHAGGHLSLRATKTWDEFAVDQGWFGVFEFMRDIPRETEIGVLIDCAGNERWNIGLCAEDLGEGV